MIKIKQEGPEPDFQIRIKEYKRKCNQCKKVWHSLASREKQIEKNMRCNACSQSSFCCNPGAQLQAKRNVEAGENELDRLKKCPNCSSSDYNEKVIFYEKK